MVDGERITPVSSSVFKEEIRRCEDLVAGVFVGRRLSYYVVRNAALKAWKPTCNLQITINGDSLFLFEFDNEEEFTVKSCR